jgi:outer membrane protein OmpA-like peptidoglycan-associated protein
MKRSILITFFIVFFAFSLNLSSQGLIKTVVAVTGSVLDQVTKEPVDAKITAYDLEGNKVNSTKSNSFQDGYYYVVGLKAGRTYEFVIETDNYMKEVVNIKVPPTDKYEEISRDFTLKPNQVGNKIKLPVAPFEINKSKLRFGSDIILSDLAATLENNRNVKFKIISYPDRDNNPENQDLTVERAQSLKDYFVIKGIDPNRISLEGKNKTDANNPPPTEKQSKGKRYIGPTYLEIESN